MIKGRQEAAELVDVDRQRKLLGVIGTRDRFPSATWCSNLRSTRDEIQNDIHALVSRGLFTGYIDWSKGILYSVEASQLQGRSTCPNCGGQLELGGKGLVKCPFAAQRSFLNLAEQ